MKHLAFTLFLFLLSSLTIAQEVTFQLDETDVCKGEEVIISLSVENFTDMASFQFSLKWDINFITLSDVNIIENGVANTLINNSSVDNGLLGLSWLGSGPTTISDVVFYDLTFDINDNFGGSTEIIFTNELIVIEATGYLDNIISIIPTEMVSGVVLISETFSSSTTIQNETGNSMNGSIDLDFSGGLLPYQVIWDNGMTTEDIENLSSGTYNCTITDAIGCVEMLGPFIVDQSSNISNLENFLTIELHPNPTKDWLIIDVQLEEHQNGILEIVNTLGQCIEKRKVTGSNWHSIIPVTNYAKGIYFLKIGIEDETGGAILKAFIKD